MSCFKVYDIYDYIEGSLSPERREELEEHLNACEKCREAVEERKLIAAAASSLPPLEVPGDFAARVMTRVEPEKTKLPVRLIVLATLSSLLALGSIGLAVSGKSLVGIVLEAGYSFWAYAKSAAVLTARAVTVLSLVGKTLQSLLESGAKALTVTGSLLSPGLQVAVLVVVTALIFSLALGARKKISLGD
jgi:anti-sigma factor RsiW